VRFFDYYHNAVQSQVGEGRAVVDYSAPRIHTLSRSGVAFLFTSLPESDESTQTYLSALQPRPGETVLDLGAYCGASAYFIAKLVGDSGLVLSFEPDEENFRALIKNIRTHALANVTAIPKGVWSETTTLTFQSEGNMGSAAASITGRETNLKKVSVLSLADVAALCSGRRIDAIKMDIEGAELAVLRHAGEFLLAHRLPRLVIEPHFIDGRMVTEELRTILHGYGYQTRLLSQGVQNWPLISAYAAA
jgi:FkbM family methyltransferase